MCTFVVVLSRTGDHILSLKYLVRVSEERSPCPSARHFFSSMPHVPNTVSASSSRSRSPTSRENTAATAAGPVPKPLWFDVLPDDVCVRIAAYVSGGATHNPNGLALAEASPRQRKTLASLLDGTYDCEYCGQGQPWVDVFRDHVLKIVCWEACAESAHLPSLSLMMASTLRSLCITGSNALLHLVTRCVNVTHLEIKVVPEMSVAALLKALSTPTLKELILSCERDRLLWYLSHQGDDSCSPEDLILRCCNLEALEIQSLDSCEMTSRMLPLLRSLRAVLACGPFAEESRQRLRSLDQVKVYRYSCHNYPLAVDLGANVTHLLVADTRVSAQMLAGLRGCRRLQELDAILDDGAEAELPCLLEHASELRALSLCWPGERAIPGKLLEAVRCARNLKCLNVNACFSTKETVAILKEIGARLVEFTSPRTSSGECKYDRWRTLMISASMYNRHLRAFDIVLPSDLSQAKKKAKRSRLDEEISRKRRQVFLAFTRLLQYAPFLTMDEFFEDCIGNFK